MLKRSTLILLVVMLATLLFSASAFAMGFAIKTRSFPSNITPGHRALIMVELLPLGAEPPQGNITVTDTLPHGLMALKAGDTDYTSGAQPGVPYGVLEHGYSHCSGVTTVTCTIDPSAGLPYKAGRNLRLAILVLAEPNVSGTVVNRVTVSGGGAFAVASTTGPIAFSSAEAPFGLQQFDAVLSDANGSIDTQAGSHPYEAIFAFSLNTKVLPEDKVVPAGGEIKDVTINLPPGFVGDPNATVQCTQAQLNIGACPPASQVGVETTGTESILDQEPVYNMVPPPGAPAEFAFNIFNRLIYVVSSPRTGGDNGITAHTDDLPQDTNVYENVFTLWGVPGDPRHDRERGGCIEENYRYGTVSGQEPASCHVSGESSTPLLTLPTQCAGPPLFTADLLAWEGYGGITAHASSQWHDSQGNPTGITGCEPLHFEPSLTLAPDTGAADTPAGLTAEVKPPLGGLLEPEGLSPSDVQNTTVTLPEGIAINPGQAAGLQACSAVQSAIGTEAAATCPAASKVGTVEITTPLLPDKIQGNVYVLQSNPPHLELLVAASADGVNLKLVGKVHLDESTGRLTTTFENTPQLPFTDFKLSFSGGAQAALATPTHCGTFTSTADFMPWSSPFVSDAIEESGFAITSGTNGASCPGSPLPFGPSLIAGSTTDQAGGFTDFSLLLQAPDDQQRVEKLQFKVPEGLLGMISKVPLCPEPRAENGTCSSVSQIGHTVVASGPGAYPLVVPQPGQPPAAIYLTGSYKGAPYGLSIVVPVVVGPFTLQTQIVRARIEVDPLTAQITVTTDPFPQVIDGVPTDLRTINAVIDRPGFMFNPTNCAPMSFSGTAWGTPPPGVGGPGATAPISSHFQMGSCQALKFKPDFKVSTSGKTSRKNGASLDVKVLYPTGSLGNNQASSQSNIAQVKVDLPKQLPSRLTTLQKACTAATFEANPAACPVASRVGQVTAVTPVLPVPLTGPAIFVSYGGAKFPELVFVLQGYGVTVYVHAETFISKAGITSSTLRRVPDVPISSFELKLPQGPFSALAANGKLCQSKLKMPTAFTAQNGAVIHQSTPISVTGCPKTKKAKRAKGAKRPNRRRGGRAGRRG